MHMHFAWVKYDIIKIPGNGSSMLHHGITCSWLHTETCRLTKTVPCTENRIYIKAITTWHEYFTTYDLFYWDAYQSLLDAIVILIDG